MSIVIQLLKLHPDVPTPAYGTSMSACFDLSFQPCERFSISGYDYQNDKVDRFCKDGNLTIHPGDRLLVPTGLVMKICGDMRDRLVSPPPPHPYSIRLHARSGHSYNKGLILANSQGVIDMDYQKEIFVMLTNISGIKHTICKGERIAQAEVVENHIAYFELVDSITQHSERDGGFGSTGHA